MIPVSNISELIQIIMHVEETIKLYIKGDGSIVQYLLPGIFRLSKNKRLKRDILQNTKSEKVSNLMLE